MEEAFNKLKQDQKNNVDNLIKWMKDSKLIDETKAAEDKARKLFSDVKDKSNVELDSFKQAVSKIAEEQKKSVEELATMLSAAGPKLLEAVSTRLTDALTAGASAFKDALTKK